jgi:predicted ATPase/DNA-binding SARP family transcriptional activator
VQIALLGPLEVRADTGAPVEVGGARLRTLLILLALDPGRVVPTSRLVDRLWEDGRPAGAANALQALVSRLRRTVPDIRVESRPVGYRLVLEPDEVDARRFERLAAAGRRRLPDDPAAAAGTLREALGLWRGPALADVAGAEFARAPVARLTELRLAAIEDRVEADLRLGAGPSLAAELEELVAAHPLREPLIGQLMRALHAAGQPSAALTAYEQARGRLADQLGVDPSAALTALHLALLRGEPLGNEPVRGEPVRGEPPRGEPVRGEPVRGEPPRGEPVLAGGGGAGSDGHGLPAGRRPALPTRRDADRPAAGPDRSRTNLRTELTSFVGRRDEAGRVGSLLADARLVTLTGPGGAGKTRLAIEAARPLLDRTPDGVWLVELAPVTDAAEVPQAVLAALGLREQALIPRARMRSADESADPTGRLAAGLARKQLLLILDNCEHLVEAAAALADRILGECPLLRILTTSREPLGITGETLWPVPPLALPPADAGAATALGYASVQLLAERAAAVRPGFTVDSGNAAAMVQICRALDGMPLAIELAAARLRAMTPAQVAARLDDRFRLLTAGSRTALPRHRTLQAVVDWSWDLLDAAEQALWRRLAVFAGGATAEAAARVCAGGAVPAEQVADLLTALVDKSLLVPTGAGEPRYRLLETIRVYGLDRLADAGEQDRLRRLHAAFFRDLAETAEPRLQTREQLHWLARLGDEHDNLHAALRGAITAGEAETAARLAGALGWYWWLRGHRAEGSELTRQALELPGEVPAGHRALACAWAALNGFGAGQDPALVVRWLRDARAARAEVEATGAVGHPMLRLLEPFEAMFSGEDQDRALVELRARYDDPEPWLAAIARVMHAAVAGNLGRGHAEMEADCREAMDRFTAIGERWGMSLTLSVLAQLTGLRGEHADSAGYYERALALAAELGAEEDLAQAGTALAHELWLLGRTARAWEVLADARRRAERVGLPESLAAVQYTEGEFARRTGDLDAARGQLQRAAATAAAPGVARQLRAAIAGSLGSAEVAAGDLAAARLTFVEALDAAVASVDAPIVAQVLVGVADLALHTGDPARATALLGATESILGLPQPSLIGRPEAAAAARDALGEPAFTEAYRRGRDTTMQTVQALAGLQPVPTPDA